MEFAAGVDYTIRGGSSLVSAEDGMSDAFWTGFFQMLPVAIPACMAAYMTWRNGQRDKVGREAGAQDRAAIAKAVGVPTEELHTQTQTIAAHSGIAPLDKP